MDQQPVPPPVHEPPPHQLLRYSQSADPEQSMAKAPLRLKKIAIKSVIGMDHGILPEQSLYKSNCVAVLTSTFDNSLHNCANVNGIVTAEDILYYGDKLLKMIFI